MIENKNTPKQKIFDFFFNLYALISTLHDPFIQLKYSKTFVPFVV